MGSHVLLNQLTEEAVFGVTKVKKQNELLPAIKVAFEHGTEVTVEENIEGREVTCAATETAKE